METITEGLWEACHDIRLPGGIYFNSRMSVIDVGDGELILHSPVPLDDELGAAIDDVGEVRWIVAPNDLHHLYVEAAADRYPDAAVWGTPGARQKQSGVDFDGALEESWPDDWRGIEAVHVHGTRNWAETVFFLPERRTLICTDLVFNIRETRNLRTRWLLKLVGAYGKLAQSRAERWFLIKDKRLAGEAFQHILRWDFDRLVVGHGQIVESGAHQAMASILDWAIEPSTAALPA